MLVLKGKREGDERKRLTEKWLMLRDWKRWQLEGKRAGRGGEMNGNEARKI